MPTRSRCDHTTHAGSSAKLPPDKPTTRSTSSKTKTPKHSNVSSASPYSSVPSPVLPTQKRKLPSTDAGPVPKKSTPGLGDLLEARGVRESALAVADSCESLLCAESDVSGVLSSDNDLPISGNSGEALHLQLSPSGYGPPDPAGKLIDSLSLVAPTSVPNSLIHSSSLQSLASNHSQPHQTRSSAVSHSACINLDSKSPVPASTRKIFLSPTQSSKKLTHLNPCLLKKDIDSLCANLLLYYPTVRKIVTQLIQYSVCCASSRSEADVTRIVSKPIVLYLIFR